MVYLYTSEFYPADVRGTAMGMGSSVARVGLMLTPFVAQWLVSSAATTVPHARLDRSHCAFDTWNHTTLSFRPPFSLSKPRTVAQQDNLNLYLAMSIYSAFAWGAVYCMWSMPIETTGRPMLTTMDELVSMVTHTGAMAVGVADTRPTLKNDPSGHEIFRALRWTAKFDGYNPKQVSAAASGGGGGGGEAGAVRQRSSLLKAVITAFPSVSLPFLAVPLLSQPTVANRRLSPACPSKRRSRRHRARPCRPTATMACSDGEL
eukprot:SAG22_NODE_326_length_12283_cov_248.386408_9_plen_261_part_00